MAQKKKLCKLSAQKNHAIINKNQVTSLQQKKITQPLDKKNYATSQRKENHATSWHTKNNQATS